MVKRNLEEWRIPLDEEDKQGLLREAAAGDDLFPFCKDFLIIVDIYATDVALAVHLRWVDRKEGEDADSSDGPPDNNPVKAAVGRLLRLVASYAEKLGFILPVIGIIEAAVDKEDMINRWAADQDWHRGDFSLLPVSVQGSGLSAGDDQDTEKLVSGFLSGASTVWADIKRLRPLNLDEYLARLEEERQLRTLPPEHGSLLDAIMLAWKEKKPTESAIAQWLERRLKDVSKLMERG